jgi:hypothetical protein
MLFLVVSTLWCQTGKYITRLEFTLSPEFFTEMTGKDVALFGGLLFGLGFHTRPNYAIFIEFGYRMGEDLIDKGPLPIEFSHFVDYKEFPFTFAFKWFPHKGGTRQAVRSFRITQAISGNVIIDTTDVESEILGGAVVSWERLYIQRYVFEWGRRFLFNQKALEILGYTGINLFYNQKMVPLPVLGFRLRLSFMTREK